MPPCHCPKFPHMLRRRTFSISGRRPGSGRAPRTAACISGIIFQPLSVPICRYCMLPPLARWCRGFVVQLEKIVGNVFVHKLRTICLLEADFNWRDNFFFKVNDATGWTGRGDPSGMLCKETQLRFLPKSSSMTALACCTIPRDLTNVISATAMIELPTLPLVLHFRGGGYPNQQYGCSLR
jgi:hypothetical protein